MFHDLHKPADFTGCTIRSRLGAEFLQLSHSQEWGEEKIVLINEEHGMGKIVCVVLQSIRRGKEAESNYFVRRRRASKVWVCVFSVLYYISRC